MSPGQISQRHEQRQGEPNNANPSDQDLLILDANALDPIDTNLAILDTNGTNLDGKETSKEREWSDDYSLDERPGYSFQLVGLSSETDPFLLRHYQYDTRDTFRMFGLDFRKVTDDKTMQRPADSSQSSVSQIPATDTPIQFVMTNEQICEDDMKIIDKDFAGSNTEAEDHTLLYKLVPIDLGSRLLKL